MLLVDARARYRTISKLLMPMLPIFSQRESSKEIVVRLLQRRRVLARSRESLFLLAWLRILR
jgi:hypothetical protein